MITVKLKEGLNEVELSKGEVTVDYLLDLLYSHKNGNLTIVELLFDDYRVTNVDKLASSLILL